jgi:hypothetical protein
MSLGPNSIVPQFQAPSVSLDDPVLRTVIPQIRGNMGLSSTTFPTNSSADRAGRFTFGTRFVGRGIPRLQERDFPASVLIDEKWMADPPADTYDQGASAGSNPWAPADAPISAFGKPAHWGILAAEGYKRNGLAILLEYPGGAPAYFSRFCVKAITAQLIQELIPSSQLMLQDYTNPAWVTPAQWSTWIAAIAKYDGLICLNTEAWWPYGDRHMAEHKFAGAYLAIFRQVLRRVRGAEPTDAELRDAWYALAHEQFGRLQLNLIRSLCPRAKICRYNWPMSLPEGLAGTYSENAEKLRTEDLSEALQRVCWSRLDALAPALGYVRQSIVPDNAPVAGSYTYSFYQYVQDAAIQRVREMRTAMNKEIWLYARAVHNSGRLLTPLEAQANGDVIDRTSPDRVILWDGIGLHAGATSVEQSLAFIEQAAQLQQPYLNGYGRTQKI